MVEHGRDGTMECLVAGLTELAAVTDLIALRLPCTDVTNSY